VKGHLIADQRTETMAGLVLFLAAVVLLHDAYERRGRAQPFYMRLLSTP